MFNNTTKYKEFDYLNSLFLEIQDSDLNRKIEGIEDYAEKELLRFWQVHAPHFTDHSTMHCKNILSNLDRLIPTNVAVNMNEYEIFLLLCGVWLHDVGMMVRKSGESLESVRKHHHEKGRELIRTGLAHIDLTEEERYIVGELTFFHRKSEDIGKTKEIIEVQHNSTTSKVRLRFLCALLRLADGFEIAHSRASRTFTDISGIDKEALFYHEAHLHVLAVGFHPITKEIVVYLRVKDHEDSKLLTNFLTSDLEKELSSVRDVLKENEIDYDSVKCDVTIDPFARKMPKFPTKTKTSLQEKIVELANITGYFPNMVNDTRGQIFISYETISQTTKELQQEIVVVLEKVRSIFSEEGTVFLSINRVYDPARTTGDVDPEVIALVSKKEDFVEYQSGTLDRREFWNKLIFLRVEGMDQFHKIRRSFEWPLLI